MQPRTHQRYFQMVFWMATLKSNSFLLSKNIRFISVLGMIYPEITDEEKFPGLIAWWWYRMTQC
jgi:hypothetical protein